MTSTIMPWATCHMPMPDFEAVARDIRNRASHHVGAATTETRLFSEFFMTSELVVKKHGSCSRGIHSSQRVAARIICFGPFIL